MSDGPLSFLKSWEGFLPPNTVIMAKRQSVTTEAVAVLPEASPAGVAERLVVERRVAAPRFGFAAPDVANPAARELLTKIFAALDLRPEDAAVFPEAPADFSGRVLVRLVASEAEAGLVGEWRGSTLTTYSLGAMLANPGLKKPVWAHLKEAIARTAQ
jgi:hypothetical protein